MRILGINTTSSHVYLIDFQTSKKSPDVVGRFPVSSEDWLSLDSCLSAQFEELSAHGPIECVAVLRCFSGPRGSSVEAIKAEAIAELVAMRRGHAVVLVAPQSLKKALGCSTGLKWQERARELFNSRGKVKYFSAGMDGAMAAAVKAAGDRGQEL